jgi:AraC-like DNA-binding protein/sugar lactone lactonase YvrE
MALLVFTATNVWAQLSTFRSMDVTDGLSDNQVLQMLQLEDGRMAIATVGNVNIYDGNKFYYIHRKDSYYFPLPDYGGYYHLYVDRNQRLWVKDTRKLLCMDLRTEKYVSDIDATFRRLGVKDRIRDFFIDADRNIWLVLDGGNGKRIMMQTGKPDSRFILPRPNLQDMETVGDRLYLFYSDGSMTCHLRKQGTPLLYTSLAYPKEESPLFDNTSLVVRGPHGMLYQLRTGRKSALFAFNTASRQWKKLLQEDYTLHTLVVTRQNRAYITCVNGYWSIDLNRNTYQYIDRLQLADGSWLKTGLNTMRMDSEGGIWLGTYSRGLFYASPQTNPFVFVRDLDAGEAADKLSADKIKGVDGRRNDHYNDVFRDSRGWTWCATDDGLLLRRHGKSRMIYTEDGLCNNLIHSITEDDAHNIWVCTSFGISRIACPSLTILNFQRDYGIHLHDYLNGKAVKLSGGRIAMQATDGWTVFRPSEIKRASAVLHPLLVGVQLHGKPLTTGSSLLPEAPPYIHAIEFKYNQNSLAFDFAAMNYICPYQTYFRYQLCKGDNVVYRNVSLSTNNLLHLPFVDLSPGTYTLRVSASTEPDRWCGKVSVITFKISSPWWLSTAAVCSYILLAILLAVGSMALYLHLMRQKMRRKNHEDILLTRIRDLVERCSQLESSVSEEPEPQEQMSEQEIDFMNRATVLVEKNLTNPAYSVEQLSRDLCMERTGLYKKLTQMLDKSPTVFIRNIRLERAALLLKRGNMSIGEIADAVGFCSSSYMSKCFQEKFGCKPSEYK